MDADWQVGLVADLVGGVITNLRRPCIRALHIKQMIRIRRRCHFVPASELILLLRPLLVSFGLVRQFQQGVIQSAQPKWLAAFLFYHEVLLEEGHLLLILLFCTEKWRGLLPQQ